MAIFLKFDKIKVGYVVGQLHTTIGETILENNLAVSMHIQ